MSPWACRISSIEVQGGELTDFGCPGCVWVSTFRLHCVLALGNSFRIVILGKCTASLYLPVVLGVTFLGFVLENSHSLTEC